MKPERDSIAAHELRQAGLKNLPSIITRAGPHAEREFVEFFAVNIRNKRTRAIYARAIERFFDWCKERRLTLERIEAAHVAAYIEQYADRVPTINQHLAAIRMLFNFLVRREMLLMNPAASVYGPQQVVSPCGEREQLGEAMHQATAEL